MQGLGKKQIETQINGLINLKKTEIASLEALKENILIILGEISDKENKKDYYTDILNENTHNAARVMTQNHVKDVDSWLETYGDTYYDMFQKQLKDNLIQKKCGKLDFYTKIKESYKI